MSQIDFLRSIDAAITGAFLGAGMASAGTYQPPGTTGDPPAPHPVQALDSILVDRGFAAFGDDAAPVAGGRVVVTLFRAQIAQPVINAIVVCDGETWKLAKEVEQDASYSQWVAVNG